MPRISAPTSPVSTGCRRNITTSCSRIIAATVNRRGRRPCPGLVTDAETAIAWLAARPEVHAQGMAVFGQSLGGSLAVYAVAHSPERALIKTLIIDSAFSSYRRIAREKLAGFWLTWALQWPLSFTVDDQYSPIDAIAAVSPIPLLIIHSVHDPIVPISHAEALYAAAQQPKALWKIAQGGHIQALTHEEAASAPERNISTNTSAGDVRLNRRASSTDIIRK